MTTTTYDGIIYQDRFVDTSVAIGAGGPGTEPANAWGSLYEAWRAVAYAVEHIAFHCSAPTGVADTYYDLNAQDLLFRLDRDFSRLIIGDWVGPDYSPSAVASQSCYSLQLDKENGTAGLRYFWDYSSSTGIERAPSVRLTFVSVHIDMPENTYFAPQNKGLVKIGPAQLHMDRCFVRYRHWHNKEGEWFTVNEAEVIKVTNNIFSLIDSTISGITDPYRSAIFSGDPVYSDQFDTESLTGKQITFAQNLVIQREINNFGHAYFINLAAPTGDDWSNRHIFGNIKLNYTNTWGFTRNCSAPPIDRNISEFGVWNSDVGEPGETEADGYSTTVPYAEKEAVWVDLEGGNCNFFDIDNPDPRVRYPAQGITGAEAITYMPDGSDLDIAGVPRGKGAAIWDRGPLTYPVDNAPLGNHVVIDQQSQLDAAVGKYEFWPGDASTALGAEFSCHTVTEGDGGVTPMGVSFDADGFFVVETNLANPGDEVRDSVKYQVKDAGSETWGPEKLMQFISSKVE